MINYIKESIQESIAAKERLLENENILATLETVATLIYNTIKAGGRVLLCGNGGSAADAQHIAAELVVRFVYERRGLSAIALTTDSSILTAIGNDYGFDYVFERQVEALSQPGDVLIGISTSGNSANVLAALRKAKDLGVATVGMLGGNGGLCKEYLDYDITIDASVTARIQESHILCGHIICGLIDELVVSEKKEVKAVFLDRDGTINYDEGYTYKVEDLRFIEGVVEALTLMQKAGYKLIIVTNQSGIGRGYFSIEDCQNFNDAMVESLAQKGIVIDDILMCPHAPDEDCVCRKPLPYLVNEASERYNIDKTQSFMLGDKKSDIECGERAGLQSCLVTKEHNLLYWANRIINENR
ncbi:MAG: D-glycero-beta-D-manno-heptose 1,7-bisphosphate 7-phosphatase [Rikenellaceae bacterium]